MDEDERGGAGLPRAPKRRARIDGDGGSAVDDAGARIQAGKHRLVQVARLGGRKLFDAAAKAVFLEWFAATCNLAWAAERAGFNYKTVLRHRMTDAHFAEDWDRAVRQGYARLEAKRLETKRRDAPIGIEGDHDAPEMDDMDPARMDDILRERGRQMAGVRKAGRPPQVAASNEEVRAALIRGLKALGVRVSGEAGEGEATPPPCSACVGAGSCPPDTISDRLGRSEAPTPSPGNPGEENE